MWSMPAGSGRHGGECKDCRRAAWRRCGQDQTIEGDAVMKREPFELIRGSENVYRDLCKDNPDLMPVSGQIYANTLRFLWHIKSR
jgi:hypothetical protein